LGKKQRQIYIQVSTSHAHSCTSHIEALACPAIAPG